jgi:hypothetical protein
MQTDILSLPLITAAQAQKHVTHNEALAMIDAMVQISVLSASTLAPPSSPQFGARYIVPQNAQADWVGKDNSLAHFNEIGWQFFSPATGWLAYVVDQGNFLHFNAAGWQSLIATSALQSLPALSINMTPTGSERFSVQDDASLLNHDGSDHRLKINKAAQSNTASVLFSENFVSKAEVGLAGDNQLHFKVSPDGNTWQSSVQLDPITGFVGINAAPQERLHIEEGIVRIGLNQISAAMQPGGAAL